MEKLTPVPNVWNKACDCYALLLGTVEIIFGRVYNAQRVWDSGFHGRLFLWCAVPFGENRPVLQVSFIQRVRCIRNIYEDSYTLPRLCLVWRTVAQQ